MEQPKKDKRKVYEKPIFNTATGEMEDNQIDINMGQETGRPEQQFGEFSDIDRDFIGRLSSSPGVAEGAVGKQSTFGKFAKTTLQGINQGIMDNASMVGSLVGMIDEDLGNQIKSGAQSFTEGVDNYIKVHEHALGDDPSFMDQVTSWGFYRSMVSSVSQFGVTGGLTGASTHLLSRGLTNAGATLLSAANATRSAKLVGTAAQKTGQFLHPDRDWETEDTILL